MSYTDFVKPYVDGWENGESGNTPITAEILNNNYDAFLIALNTWGAGVDTSLASKVTDANYVHTDNNYTSTEKNKLSGIASGATSTAFSRVVSSGTKLGTLTINGTTYDIYAPNPGAGSLSDLTDVTLTSPSNGQVLKYDAANSKWVNANESGGGGGSYSPNGVTYVIDNNGTDSVTTGHTYAYENKISKYVDGVLDSSGSWSYAQSMTTPTNYFIVGNLKSTYTNISGSAYWIVTVVDGYVRYNNVVYEANEEIFRVAVRSGTDESFTGFEEVVEASPSVVEWDQIQQTGTKIATITIDGTDIDVYAPTSGGASSFSGLSDVDISTPSTGQVPIYNATTSKWENGALNVGDDVSFTQIQSTGTKIGTITINSTDYDIYAPTSGGASSLSGLSDVALNSPSNGQILEYDGTTSKWKNANAPTVPDEITDLNDVSVSSLQNGQILKWNSTSSKWENANESGGGGGTTVVANPSGAATEELEKLQVGNTIYEVPSGGSGGSDIVDIQGTLTAGSTSITLQSSKIKTTSVIGIYTDIFGVSPTAVTVANGSITLTFPAQQSDMGVLVSVRKVNLDIVFDLPLPSLETGKTWFAYDNMKGYVTCIDTEGDGIHIYGGEAANDWTTSGTLCFDLSEFSSDIPVTATAFKLHFATFVLQDYAGVRIFLSNNKYDGGQNGSDTMLRQNGSYQIESSDSTDASGFIEIPISASTLSNYSYMYIMAMTGIVHSTLNNYSNNNNGSFDIQIDGINFVTGGNS